MINLDLAVIILGRVTFGKLRIWGELICGKLKRWSKLSKVEFHIG